MPHSRHSGAVCQTCLRPVYDPGADHCHCCTSATCRARYGVLYWRFEMESGGSASPNAAKGGWRLKSRLNGLAALRHEVRLRGLPRTRPTARSWAGASLQPATAGFVAAGRSGAVSTARAPRRCPRYCVKPYTSIFDIGCRAAAESNLPGDLPRNPGELSRGHQPDQRGATSQLPGDHVVG